MAACVALSLFQYQEESRGQPAHLSPWPVPAGPALSRTESMLQTTRVFVQRRARVALT